MTDLKTIIESRRDARRMERRIKDLVRKSMRTSDRISTATIAAKTGADVETVRRVIDGYLASPRLRLRELKE